MDELADAFLRWRASSSSSELQRLLLRSYGRTEEAEEIEIELASWLTGAWGMLMSWLAVPGRPRRVAARSGDWRCTAYTRPSDSEPIEHCSSPFSDQTNLTVQLQRINTTKPLINSENCVHENCSPTFHLQLLFKDHSLIHHESEVTSSQSCLDLTRMVFMS